MLPKVQAKQTRTKDYLFKYPFSCQWNFFCMFIWKKVSDDVVVVFVAKFNKEWNVTIYLKFRAHACVRKWCFDF